MLITEPMLQQLTIIAYAVFGQLFRVLYGVKQAADKGEQIRLSRIGESLLYAALGGVFVGLFAPDFKTAFFAGLATSDAVEAVMKLGGVK